MLEFDTFEVEDLFYIVLLLDVFLVRLRLELREVIIEHTFLLGVHDGQEQLVADADALVHLVVSWNKISLIISHKLIEVSEVVLAFIIFFLPIVASLTTCALLVVC